MPRAWTACGLAALLVSLLITCTMPAAAVTVRTKPPVVTVAQNETVDDTLIASGQVIHIDGTVNGDVIALGQRVEVRGHIKGTLLSLGQSTDVRGEVDGNVMTAGQSVSVSGQVKGNWYVAGQSVRLEPGGRLDGDLFAAGAIVAVDGVVQRSVQAAAQITTVTGTVGRDITARGESVNLGSSAKVGGKVTARVRNLDHVRAEPGATIAGGIDKQLRLASGGRERRFNLVGILLEFAGALLAGLVLLALAPAFLGAAAESIRSPWRSLGLGLAILVAAPVAMILVAITVVGIPLALLTLAAYLSAVYLAKIIVAGFIGRVIRRGAPATRWAWLLALAIGLAILTAAFRMPYGVGFVLRVATACLGLGALGWQLYQTGRTAKSA